MSGYIQNQFVMEISHKPWVTHIIVAGGIIVAGFIIIGFFNVTRFFVVHDKKPEQPRCTNCITLDHNNTQRVVRSGIELTLELPEATFAPEDIVIISNPPEIIEIYTAEPREAGNWARTLNLIATGTAELIVPSTLNDSLEPQKDFHISLTIQ
jgi:hypothetical protein